MITDEPKETHAESIVVVSAAIVDTVEKRLFVQRRSRRTRFAWHWCTPGGKVHEGESLWNALLRELDEEHGIIVRQSPRNELAKQDPVYIHDSPPSGLAMMGTCVICMHIPHTSIAGPIRANAEAVAGFDWVTANELETLTLTPADDANRGKLMALLR